MKCNSPSARSTLAAIVEQWIVYRKPREPRIVYAFAERAAARKHLEQLLAAGRVSRDGDR